MQIQASDIAELWPYLTEQERAEFDRALNTGRAWEPLAGPQLDAYNSPADVTGYGGAAGGGKTDLAIGLATTKHKRSIIYRREGTQLLGILERATQIIGGRQGYNGQDKIWRLPDRTIEFGGVPNAGDEKKFQGRPHDLKVFDEVTEFLEIQVRFLMGWLRSEDPHVKTRVLMTFNPPTTAEGRWIIEYFAAWLDRNHPNPADPGELRYYTTDPATGKDVEVDGPEPREIDGEMVTPMSRTFIPAKVEDNPYYMATGYKRVLQALPEPLRSQMLKGDFTAGTEDDEWQVIPTSWVDEAMDRWKPRDKKDPMDSAGADIARGGRDETIIARRHGNWYDEPLAYPGAATPDGPTGAGLVMAALRDQAPAHVDVIGWGSAVYDFLNANNVHAIPVNGADGVGEMTRDGLYKLANKRAWCYWRMREDLDPVRNNGIALPPNNRLRADLCTPRWKLTPRGIQVESKEDIIQRLGRSPDYGDAYVFARIETPKRRDVLQAAAQQQQVYDPFRKLNQRANR